MLVLIPLLLTSSLVAAAPHHHRGVTKLHTTTTVATVTIYMTEDVPNTQPTQSVVQGSASISTDAGYVLSQSQNPEATPSVTKNDQTIALKVDTTSTEDTSGIEVDRMNTEQVEAIITRCWEGKIPLPTNNVPLPFVDKPAPQLSIYERPTAKANTLTVHNYCSYDIHYHHFALSNMIGSGSIPAGANIESPLSGTVFKASKSSDMASVVLIEYSAQGDNMFYDLSLINCIGQTNGEANTDTSACAGHELGLQLGNPTAKTFQCANEYWCDDQAYFYQASC
ncbi:hypothetical protein N0V83_010518 [Neocucurbitaria cava]|uniref:Uncharacterized protein n=1 Tax=Neocucurbitaria cava TaxID=798079 RepID=A0A9W8XZR9_9PLEO|nr:hypothetical protein N0V83_010518 [Neocucurbitaria cava]